MRALITNRFWEGRMFLTLCRSLSLTPPLTYPPLPLLPAPVIFCCCCDVCMHNFCHKLAISFIPFSASVLASISVSSQPRSSLRISSRFLSAVHLSVSLSVLPFSLSICLLLWTRISTLNSLSSFLCVCVCVCVCVCETIRTYRLRMTSSFYSAANQRQAHGALPSEECYVHKRDGERNRDRNRYAM